MDHSDTGRNDIAAGIDVTSVFLPEIQITRGRYEDNMDEADVQTIIQQAIHEYMRQDTARGEPAHLTELREERRRRQDLEKRLNEMAQETSKSLAIAAEAQRAGAIRSELHRLGVLKIELAFKAVQDRIVCAEDGRLMADNRPMSEFLREFLEENSEFLPARIAGGTGMTGTQKAGRANSSAVDLDKIGPSMSRDELERVREAIMRVGSEMNR
jgi:hypothetical protein